MQFTHIAAALAFLASTAVAYSSAPPANSTLSTVTRRPVYSYRPPPMAHTSEPKRSSVVTVSASVHSGGKTPHSSRHSSATPSIKARGEYHHHYTPSKHSRSPSATASVKARGEDHHHTRSKNSGRPSATPSVKPRGEYRPHSKTYEHSKSYQHSKTYSSAPKPSA